MHPFVTISRYVLLIEGVKNKNKETR